VLYREVVNRLRENRDAPRDKVERLLDELLEQTFLFTDLRPPHGGSPAHHVMRRLAAIESARTEAAELASLLDAAAAWDHLFDSSADDAFRSLVRRANAMVPAGNAFQVDMALPLAGRTISRAVGDEISRAAEMLIRLTPLPHGPTNLADYRQRFETRYGQHREVPILELLDPQLGLGPPQAVAKPTSQPRDDVLTRIALHALRERKRTVELDEATLADLATWDPKPEAIPLSLDLNVFVSASSVADLDAGRFQVIVGPNIGSNGAGRSLGRFGELLGPLGVEAIRNAANAEESRDPRIWAELYHVPAILRSANVTIRPAVRSYEILLGGVTSGNAQAVTIPLHELLVGVHAGRFYVRWSAVDADVVICTGDMLNHALGPEIIRFLWGASRDGLAWLSPFDWGPARGFPYLPRVQSGRIVLGSAEWRVGAIFDRRWRGSSDEAISVLRQDWQLPRYVFVSSGDNRLLIDLEDPLQRALVTRALTDPQYRQHLVFHEVLPTPDEVWMPGPGGRYVAELVASLTVCNNGSARPVETRVLGGAPPRVTPSTEARLRPPGSDWLFVKLYGPPSLQEDLITAHILGFVEDASAHGLADMWFFVRYADPDPHIRLRFQGVSAQLTSKLFPVLCRWVHGLIEHGLVHRVSFDTYDRELERYGGEAGLAVAESIFAADSRAVARLLVLLKSGSISIDRTTLAVLEVDDLLESLGLDEPTRLAWLRDFSSSRKESNEDYRRKQSELRSMLSAAPDRRVGNNGDRIAEILVQRQLALRDAAHSLHRLHVAGGLCCHLNEILRSLIHMSLNRLLGIDRLLEQKVLGLLLRTRESLAAHRIPQ
jgi:thiopeptide-type bacteriocin biosynthesis protein